MFYYSCVCMELVCMCVALMHAACPKSLISPVQTKCIAPQGWRVRGTSTKAVSVVDAEYKVHTM